LEARTVVSDALLGVIGSFLLADLACEAAPARSDIPGLIKSPRPTAPEIQGQEEFNVVNPTASIAPTARPSSGVPDAVPSSLKEADLAPAPPSIGDFLRPGSARTPAGSSRHDQPGVSTSPAAQAEQPGAGIAGQPALSAAAEPTAPSGAAPSGADPSVVLAGSFRPATTPANSNLNNSDGAPSTKSADFEVSWQAGGHDNAGQFMGGTEVMHLAVHQGKIFAGTGVLLDVPGSDPRIGAQILRLDSAHGQWQVDWNFDEYLDNGRPRFVRLEMLKEVTFTTDGAGQTLPEPVTMLLASPSDKLGLASVYSRDDSTGTWTEMVLAQSVDNNTFIRSIGTHQDTVTGVDRVFAGTSGIGVFSGVYDPAVPGRIRWDSQPELGVGSRAMAFADANGVLHMVREPDMFRRIDGPNPSWELVLSYPDPPPLASGLRGLTAIPNPDGPGEIFLAAMEDGTGSIVRIRPTPTYSMTAELQIDDFLRPRFGGLTSEWIVAAYNDMPVVVDPRTQEPVHLIGLLAHPKPLGLKRSSWYLVRHADGRYDLHQILPLANPTNANPFLEGARSMVVSPFAEDNGQAVYFAGYDVEIYPAHNTGWIYRAPLEAVLDNPKGWAAAPI
jgi:hypothetical protein